MNKRFKIPTLFYTLILLVLSTNCKKDSETIITDIDGNIYTSVTIGTQTWLIENLKTTRYRNGDSIGTTEPFNATYSDEISPKYQWAYNGDENNVKTYGRLYTWYAATDERNICPNGYHIPSKEEWDILIEYLGGENVAGGKLKEIGYSHWDSLNVDATNEAGFTALPGGWRDPIAIEFAFNSLGGVGIWWSSTASARLETYAIGRYIYTYNTKISTYDGMKFRGYSIRCIKD